MLWKLPIFGRISKIGIDPPAPATGRSGICVVAILRNEVRYVEEWAHFHARAGVQRFVIYDNGSTDGTIAALQSVLSGPRLTVVPWAQVFRDARMGREIHNQVLAYAHAARNFGSTSRWMAFIDVDEFLIPKQADDLPAALESLSDCRSISLPWHMYGRSGNLTQPEGGVLGNYRLRASNPMSDVRGVRAFKCIVDPCHLTAVRIHSMEVDGKDASCNDRGDRATEKDRNKSGFYSAGRIQLNHYYTRSEEELAAKIARGPNLVAKREEYERKVRRTVANIEADEVEDLSAINYLTRIGWE